MKLVRLKNGSQELQPLVAVTMLSLRRLFINQPVAAYELVEKCRDSSHVCFGKTAETLIDTGLMTPGEIVHESVRNIVLSAISGKGIEMILGSPIQKE